MDPANKKQIKFMSYNVWRREDVVLYKRMKAIGDLVESHNPDVIFFEEVTPDIHRIFRSFAWWKKYHWAPVGYEDKVLMLSKLPLSNVECRTLRPSRTGRGFLSADINPSPAPIRLVTAQLERPNPPSSMNFSDRYMQAESIVLGLRGCDNAVFGGDMCWDDDSDGPFPLPAGWVDAWTVLRGSTDFYHSWTYDAFWEVEAPKFNGFVARYDSMKKRSDRFVCKLTDYKLSKIELIGNPGFETYYTTNPSSSQANIFYGYDINLKPSCHRGVVLTIDRLE